MREKQHNESPITYRMRKQEILVRSGSSLFLIAALAITWILVQPQTIKLLIIVIAVWVLNRWVHMIKGLLRLGDTITLTSEGIQSKILGREEFTAWRDVEAIKIDANYSDGVYYVVSASNGKEIKFTSLLQNHLDLHARISAKVR